MTTFVICSSCSDDFNGIMETGDRSPAATSWWREPSDRLHRLHRWPQEVQKVTGAHGHCGDYCCFNGGLMVF